MKSDFIDETVRLCESILETTPPNGEWGVINLVKSEKNERVERLYHSNAYPHIPQGYYYGYDDIPQYLLEKGVFCCLDQSDFWYVKQGHYIYDTSDPVSGIILGSVFQDLTLLASSKGWINKSVEKKELNNLALWRIEDKTIDVIINSHRQVHSQREHEENEGNIWINDGPDGRHHLVVLFDKERMKQFVSENKNSVPVFDDTTGNFSFRGETVTFSGPKNIAAVKLLVDKINSRVSKKEFYESGGDTNYNQYKREEKLTQVNNALSHRFGEIKCKIYENPVLKATIVMISEGGFGMFVDSAIFTRTPDSATKNS